MSVRTFHIETLNPRFCSRRYFRRCEVAAVDNNRCAGGPFPDEDSAATVPIFATVFSGDFDPCSTSQSRVPSAPFVPNDSGMSCRLSNEFGSLDCWNAVYTLTVETFVTDLIAACLANLALIDLDAVPFGFERKVVNDPFNGSPVFSDSQIATVPSGATACSSPFRHEMAASFAFEYATIGQSFFCTQNGLARHAMPTQQLIVTASRSRFSANRNWCKRTKGPIFIDPDFSDFCVSRPGACIETACAYHLPTSGVIDLPAMNESIHIGLCTAPLAPCNSVPIAF